LMENDKQEVTKIKAEFDEEGVYFYQAFKPSIADFAVANQRFGGDDFNPSRMTWIKPSFAWVLYRSGYATKSDQERILKIKISHEAVSAILAACVCPEGGATHPPTPIAASSTRSSCGRSRGVVQWDPARDITRFDPKNTKVPRRMLRERAIQIGVQGGLSEFYVGSALSIEDVTELAREVGAAHGQKRERDCEDAMRAISNLPIEREYEALLQVEHKLRLGLVPGEAANRIAQISRGRVK